MIKLLKCEQIKNRRRYIFLSAVLVTVLQLCWALYGNYDSVFIIKNGWMSFLYQLPLINAIFLPVLSIIVSSRLCDAEHKGAMIKQLAVVTDKGKLYDAKFIYGISITLFCVIISWAVTIIFGYVIGFDGSVPIKLYLMYLLFTIVPTVCIYIFQHILSFLFKNQAVSFFAGIIGTFCGVFSMFLPSLPLLRCLVLWGSYGTLQFVGMFGWTKETRYENAYFDIMPTDFLYFTALCTICIAMYFIGRQLFCRKEV